MKWIFFFALHTVVGEHERIFAKLPKYIPACKRTGKHLDDCIVRAVNKLRPRLKKGIPVINVPSLHPFKTKEISIDVDLPLIKLQGSATDITAYGGVKFNINSFKINRNAMTSEFNLTIPRLEVTADYNTEGSKFWKVNISGSGNFFGMFTNVNVIVQGTAKKYTKDEDEFIKMIDIYSDIMIEDGEMSLKPDKNNIPAIAASHIFNTRSNKILKKLRPAINKQAGPIIRRYTNRVLSKLPLDRVLYR